MKTFQDFSDIFQFFVLAAPLLLSQTRRWAAYGLEGGYAFQVARSVDRTSQAVGRQIAAMNVQVFEVGLYKPDATDRGQPVMIPRTWDIESITRSIPWLRLQNADGRNIYIRPKGEHNLSLVDDLTAHSIQRMKAMGFAPALVIETSPGNFQAWLKHPRLLSRELSTATARYLAHDFGGDPGAADWRHFGRLAGFTNRKDKYRQLNKLFPFVRVVESIGVSYAEGDRFISRVEKQIEEDKQRREQWRGAGCRDRAALPLRSIDTFRANSLYAGDGTRVDLAYAIYALAHGAPASVVAAGIRTRDLSHKGNDKRQAEYVERTINKAQLVVEQQSRELGG